MTEDLMKSWPDFFAAQNAEIHLVWFLIHFLLTALLSFLLGKIYVRFGSALSNREAFGRNFVLISMTTMLIITIVKSSLALSLGLVGALSIIRFRAAIKEPEELSYLFLAIAIGLGMGSQQALVTVIAFAVMVTILALRFFTKASSQQPNLYLTISGDEDPGDYLGTITDVLSERAMEHRLRRIDESSGSFESSFLVRFKNLEQLRQCRTTLLERLPEARLSLIEDRGIGG